jgi:hypothetical protein
MDEIMAMLHVLSTRLEKMEQSMNELKSQQHPSNSVDFIQYLQNEIGEEFETWLSKITISNYDIYNMIEMNSYEPFLKKIDFKLGMRVFPNNKNIIYIIKNGKWKILQLNDIKLMQTTLHTHLLKVFRIMVKEKNKELLRPTIKDLSYLEQRNIISYISITKPPSFKQELYKILISLINHIAS